MPPPIVQLTARFGHQVSPAQYKFLDYLVTQTAQAKDIEPGQMQAAIWAAARDAANASTTGASFETVLRIRLGEPPPRQPDAAGTLQRAFRASGLYF